MDNFAELVQDKQHSEPTEVLPNLLYHTHLHLSNSPPKPRSSWHTSDSPSPKPRTMVTHIAEQASDSIKVQTASAVKYHRAHIPDEVSQVIAQSPRLGVSERQPRNSSPHSPIMMRSNNMAPSHQMRHVRHPSNAPLYTSSPSPNRTRSRRFRESLKPLFHIFTPTEPSTTPPLNANKQLDESRRLGSKAKVLRDTDPNTSRKSRGRSVSSAFSTSKDSHQTHSPTPQQRPTRYFRREQSNAAILEELKCEGLVGSGPSRQRKRKGRADSPNLEKPLPPLVPSLTRRNSRSSEEDFYWAGGNCEEKYWAGIADDIARRVSMLTQ